MRMWEIVIQSPGDAMIEIRRLSASIAQYVLLGV